MNLDQENIANLIGLWKKYGATQVLEHKSARAFTSTQWPHRVWIEESGAQLINSVDKNYAWLESLAASAIVPTISPAELSRFDEKGSALFDRTLFDGSSVDKTLENEAWVCTFTQLAMYKELEQQVQNQSYATDKIDKQTVDLIEVNTSEDCQIWVDLASEAFAYTVDFLVVEKLINDKSIKLFLGKQGGRVVATGLLYKTGDIIGCHQVGVKTTIQGQGIARLLMQELIEVAVAWEGKYIVLQASEAGQSLYKSLGFKAQFSIKNYQRTTKLR